MDIRLLIAFLPVIFMFHDFEEIIFINPWLNKNKEELQQKFPKLAKRILNTYGNLSTSALALAVALMFFLVSTITYASLYCDSYQWWFALFMVFGLHLFGHIFQWLIYGKYIPVIVTSILAMPYCIYTFIRFLDVTTMSWGQIILWTMIGIIIVVPYLMAALFIASKFEIWKNKTFGKV